ncbi:RbsD/FucU domain-containing protein [Asticcacaulis benevestitus]|uniref:RbsD/FucU domain-containing protein n=1 Tax=Asticcacaulis benevestitus TaxID=347481 RepID=UPI00191BDBF7|nr:RbsD/FucU domain-containing protein [Asticcacaulis benevestitus]
MPESAFRPCAFGDCERIEPIYAKFQTSIDAHDAGIQLSPILGPPFYERIKNAFAIVASGEGRLYGNISLRKGVILPDAST